MKRCESFGCSNEGVQMYQVAPATNVWLCAKCVEEMQNATDARPADRKARPDSNQESVAPLP